MGSSSQVITCRRVGNITKRKKKDCWALVFQ
jgi:hypothetical protein